MPKITVPSHWTKQDVEGFLKFIKPDKEDKEARTQLLIERPEYHCYVNRPCRFWMQTGQRDYEGSCSLQSGDCINAVFKHKKPIHWLAKE